jgi:hypothetical protein
MEDGLGGIVQPPDAEEEEVDDDLARSVIIDDLEVTNVA